MDLWIGLGLLYLAGINWLTWQAFANDKSAARGGYNRTPESTLLSMALIGGTPAAYFARRTLRHKTRKQPFSGLLHMIAALQVVAAIAGCAKLAGLL